MSIKEQIFSLLRQAMNDGANPIDLVNEIVNAIFADCVIYVPIQKEDRGQIAIDFKED